VLVELGLVEQRFAAVKDVLENGASVTDVARRNGVSRQAVHEWLVKYANHGLAGLVDRSSKPNTCPHQMSPEIEARIVEMRREHPGWGPRTIEHRLGREGIVPLPGRTSIYRCLIRHGLITPEARKRKRSDYKRWERSRSMELWQMDIVGGVRLADGSEAKIVTGIDDHSRFCISAFVVARATARPTCDALALALRTYGVPEAILTDNGKVFTGRFGKGVGEVLFDRICRENGIRHLLTAPRSPTTTGKVERFHKTLRREFLDGKVFASIEDAQRQLDAWVREYNFERGHQSLGMAVPWDRFRLAAKVVEPVDVDVTAIVDSEVLVGGATRRVGATAHQLRGRELLRGSLVGRRGGRRRVRRSARASPLPRRAHRHPRAPPLERQGTRCAAPRSATAAAEASVVGNRAIGHPQGRLLRRRQLRRHRLRGRHEVPAPPGAGRGGRRDRRDLHRRGAHPHPSGAPRPHPRAWRAGQPRRSATAHQRRVTTIKVLTQVPETFCRPGTGS
jgi:transposase InsO family protein